MTLETASNEIRLSLAHVSLLLVSINRTYRGGKGVLLEARTCIGEMSRKGGSVSFASKSRFDVLGVDAGEVDEEEEVEE